MYDEETELYYLQNRYYSAQKLRFLIPDASFGERYINVYNRLNVYRYCGNSPIMFCDPDGTIAIAAIGIGAIGTFFKYVVLPPIIGYGVSETIKAAVNEATGSGSSAIRRMRAHIAAEEIEAHPSPKPLASPSQPLRLVQSHLHLPLSQRLHRQSFLQQPHLYQRCHRYRPILEMIR